MVIAVGSTGHYMQRSQAVMYYLEAYDGHVGCSKMAWSRYSRHKGRIYAEHCVLRERNAFAYGESHISGSSDLVAQVGQYTETYEECRWL
jgi:hypothetical protein